MNNYDWGMIRDKYVTGGDDMTIAALAEHEGYPAIGTLKRHSSAESWAEQRKQYRDQVATKARGMASTNEAELRVRQIKISQAIQAKGIEAMRMQSPDELTPTEARLYIKDGLEGERKAAGIPDVLDVSFDVTKLTDEELDELIDGKA